MPKFGLRTTRQRLGSAKQAARMGPTPLVDYDRPDESGLFQEPTTPRILPVRPKTARRLGTRRMGR